MILYCIFLVAYIFLVVSGAIGFFFGLNSGGIDYSEFGRDNVLANSYFNYFIVFFTIYALVLSFFLKRFLNIYNKKIFFELMVFFLFFVLVAIFQILIGGDFYNGAFTFPIISMCYVFSIFILLGCIGIDKTTLVISNIFLLTNLLSLIVIIVGANAGIDGEGNWKGIFDQKNMLGISCVIGILTNMLVYNKRPLKFFILSIIPVILVFGSESYTSAFSCILIMILFFLKPWLHSIVYNFNKIITFVIVLIFSYMIFIATSGASYNLLDKDTSFTGRNKIWSYLFNHMDENIWLGHGIGFLSYQNTVNPDPFLDEVGYLVLSTHNGILGVIYSLGLLGLFLMIYLIFSYLFLIRKTKFSYELFIFLIIFLIVNFLEDRFLNINSLFYIGIYFYVYGKSHFFEKNMSLRLKNRKNILL